MITPFFLYHKRAKINYYTFFPAYFCVHFNAIIFPKNYCKRITRVNEIFLNCQNLFFSKERNVVVPTKQNKKVIFFIKGISWILKSCLITQSKIQTIFVCTSCGAIQKLCYLGLILKGCSESAQQRLSFIHGVGLVKNVKISHL